MDDVDAKLIELLRRSGRLSYAELGRTVGLSSPAVHDRVGKLEAAGVITGYHASVSQEAIGLGVTALVGISGGADDDVALLESLRRLPEIEDCMFVAGDESYVVKVRVPTIADLEHTLMQIQQIPGVARTRTTIALSTKWEGRVGGDDGLDNGAADPETVTAHDDTAAAPAKG
ncbi:AsnC family transcriptional regulator [Epidermidibacterium keratini]|uniref:AsnC family transcriptional regulator n=1 Tax=Epidermidibacterium keratini TaxID=1891644 RepID=A0A7L4YL26_9ACTN|nr:Lrp/AsnC family transcriptional regulator [Epidermidibacterium keratini]QHB99767.1 AsnC family transcriptional regulator [Epidermidibacterium keratini]